MREYVIMLYRDELLTVEEIAKALDISIDQVKRYLGL